MAKKRKYNDTSSFGKDYEISSDKENIIFGMYFNNELTPELLDKISKYKKVSFGHFFDQDINCLSKFDNIKELRLDAHFNHEITRWPKNLEILKFDAWDYFSDGYCLYNYELKNLPPIKEIMLGTHFNKSIDNLPDSIEKIFFVRSSHFELKINKLPKNLKKLHLGRHHKINDIFPDKSIIPKDIEWINDWCD